MKSDRLLFNSSHVTPDGLRLTGSLPFDVLDLTAERISFTSPLHYDLMVHLVNQGLLVQGEVSLDTQCECDRCLEPFDNPIHSSDVNHYIESIEDPMIDLTENIREDIVIVLPQKCVCRPDCKGLCSGCGQNRNRGNCDCQIEQSPAGAWSKLDDLQL